MLSADPHPAPQRILAHELYDGLSDAPRRDQAIEIRSGRIAALRPAAPADRANPDALRADVVAPGFIDLQINGANDAQFNFDPTVATLERIAHGARRGGTTHILPTYITAPGRDFRAALTAGRDAIHRGVPGILGVHLEGPFLSHAFPGIHPKAAIRSIEPEDVALITEGFPGIVLATIAPECQPPGVLAQLARAGVIVFIGHSAATAAAVLDAEAAGLRGATHLFNAMSQLTGREPGVAGAVLASETLFAGIIADGHHVAWPNLRIAARLLPDRLCLVTDAMLTLAGRRTAFELDGETISLKDERLTNAAGRLAGAHVAMDESVRNMVRHAGIAPASALRMASTNPARALGLSSELGSVQPGYRASLTLLNESLQAQCVVVDGQPFPIRSDDEFTTGAGDADTAPL